MLKALSVATLGASLVAFASLPAQALEVGVVIKPQIVLETERPHERVVVVERERHHYHPVDERRVVVVEKHKHWKHRDRHREVVHVIEHRDDTWRHPYGGMEREREIVVVRR